MKVVRYSRRLPSKENERLISGSHVTLLLNSVALKAEGARNEKLRLSCAMRLERLTELNRDLIESPGLVDS